MFFCAGMAVITLLYIYQQSKEISPILFAFIATVIITAYEFVFGIVFNIWLKCDVWNYSNVPLNILGQICLPFSAIWFGFGLIIFCLFKAIKI